MNAVSNACKSTLSTYIHIVPLMAFCDHLALLRRQVVSGVYTYVEVKSKLCLYAYFPNNFGLAPWLRHAGDGSVVTWGNARVVGDSAKVQAKLAADVQFICSTNFAFAALKGDGSVVCWGIVHGGGDNTNLQEQLAGDVEHIFSNNFAFAAVKSDGSVVTWSNEDRRGEMLNGLVL